MRFGARAVEVLPGTALVENRSVRCFKFFEAKLR